jgi:GNAT superfamily N-acetyltransferase
MSQLRPKITFKQFYPLVQEQMAEGYRLACVMEGETVLAVAGYRTLKNLAWGKFLYVDDLVTDTNRRSQGVGTYLLSWLKAEAKRKGCAELHLDSGVQRKDAHRFYDREGMNMLGYHYAVSIS